MAREQVETEQVPTDGPRSSRREEADSEAGKVRASLRRLLRFGDRNRGSWLVVGSLPAATARGKFPLAGAASGQ